MRFLKRKNKKFDYQPRYYQGDNPYKFEQKFDQFRSTVGPSKGFKGKWNEAMNEFKSSEKGINRTIFYIISVLVFLFLYVIDFDLSIFLK